MHIEYMKRIGELYESMGYSPYNWVINEDTPPWQPLKKPLSECRLCLLASGGIYVTGQTAFHYKDDTSYRAIPKNVKTQDLRATHFAYDLTAVRTDPNAVFPIDILRRLAADGFIGGLTAHAYTFMGGIYSSRRVREEMAPRLVKQMLVEGADLALLVPC
jgi:D-proline reductase (dithiol) PrdB